MLQLYDFTNLIKIFSRKVLSKPYRTSARALEKRWVYLQSKYSCRWLTIYHDVFRILIFWADLLGMCSMRVVCAFASYFTDQQKKKKNKKWTCYKLLRWSLPKCSFQTAKIMIIFQKEIQPCKNRKKILSVVSTDMSKRMFSYNRAVDTPRDLGFSACRAMLRALPCNHSTA